MKNLAIICSILLITTTLSAKPKWWKGRKDLKVERIVEENKVTYYRNSNPMNEKIHLYEEKYMIEKTSEFRIIYFNKGHQSYTVEYYPPNEDNVYNIKYIIEYDERDRLHGYYTKYDINGNSLYERYYEHGVLKTNKELNPTEENLSVYK